MIVLTIFSHFVILGYFYVRHYNFFFVWQMVHGYMMYLHAGLEYRPMAFYCFWHTGWEEKKICLFAATQS